MSGAGGVGLLFSNARPRAKTIARLVPECEIASARPVDNRKMDENSCEESVRYAENPGLQTASGRRKVCAAEAKFGINAACRPGETRPAACYSDGMLV
jgi:hypothetical protein